MFLEATPRPLKAILVACVCISLSALCITAGMKASMAEGAATGPAPKLLFDPAAADADKLITPTSDQVSATVASDGITLTLPAGVAYPGIVIKPATGESWDISAYGHVEVRLTNLGDKRAGLSLQVENEEGHPPFSCEKISLAPGESKTLKVVLGYFYGQYSRKFHSATVKQIRLYTSKLTEAQKLLIEQLQSAGAAGEKLELPPVKYHIVPKPANGVLFAAGTKFSDPKQLVGSKDGATIAPAADGQALDVTFTGGKEQSVALKGSWNLNAYLQVKVKLKNTGQTPMTPGVQLEDNNLHHTPVITTAAPLASGAEAEITVPFAAAVPWKGIVEKAQEVADGPKQTWDKEGQPGTGTAYRSNLTSGITIVSDATPGAKQLQVISIIAGLPPPPQLPDWLGKKPPVDGEWVKTFDENFDGNTIDLTKWNIYGDNPWDPRTHFSKDNTIVKDGILILRLEKKYGDHNDDPKEKDTDYATGYADTYGKWVQRYGYFEARMKLPTAPNMFLAFWMMPDRGLKAGPQWKRCSTGKLTGAVGNDTGVGGMEFDIMETLSVWGPYRHDFGTHWDWYAKNHKSLGMFTAYVPPDKDGFISVGMLWTPGLVVMYDNGKEAARWESPRISDIPSYFMFDLVTGGWEAEPLDDTKLPADFVIDYVRAWQRKDLASDLDGPKPNQGTPAAPTK